MVKEKLYLDVLGHVWTNTWKLSSRVKNLYLDYGHGEMSYPKNPQVFSTSVQTQWLCNRLQFCVFIPPNRIYPLDAPKTDRIENLVVKISIIEIYHLLNHAYIISFFCFQKDRRQEYSKMAELYEKQRRDELASCSEDIDPESGRENSKSSFPSLDDDWEII